MVIFHGFLYVYQAGYLSRTRPVSVKKSVSDVWQDLGSTSSWSNPAVAATTPCLMVYTIPHKNGDDWGMGWFINGIVLTTWVDQPWLAMISPHVSSCFIMFLDEAHEFTARKNVTKGKLSDFPAGRWQVPSRPAGVPFFPATLLHVTVQTIQFHMGSVSPRSNFKWLQVGASPLFHGKNHCSTYVTSFFPWVLWKIAQNSTAANGRGARKSKAPCR